VVLAEGEDAVHVGAERLVELAHGDVVATAGAAQDVPDAVGHRQDVGGAKRTAQFVDDLVGASEFSVAREEATQRRPFFLGPTSREFVLDPAQDVERTPSP